jgi:DNA-binding transcriptional ArsR family regulator
MDVPQNTLSSHLNILAHAGLINSVRRGRSLIYAVEIEATKTFMNYLVADCSEGHPEICDLKNI